MDESNTGCDTDGTGAGELLWLLGATTAPSPPPAPYVCIVLRDGTTVVDNHIGRSATLPHHVELYAIFLVSTSPDVPAIGVCLWSPEYKASAVAIILFITRDA
jgi:hypothetical protein